MTSPTPVSTTAARLAGPLYLIAALLVLLPAADFVSNVWPVQPGEVRWRFGMVGLLSGFLLTPLLGLVLAAVTAAIAQHRLAQRVVGITCWAGAAILVAFVALFALDVLQLRSTVPADRLGAFDFANVRAIIKHLLGAAALGWLGMAGLRGAAVATAGARRPDKRAAVLAPSAAAPRG